MEIVRKVDNGTVPFATVATGDVFAENGELRLYQKIKVPGDDGQYATELGSGMVQAFDRDDAVQHVAGHFEET